MIIVCFQLIYAAALLRHPDKDTLSDTRTHTHARYLLEPPLHECAQILLLHVLTCIPVPLARACSTALGTSLAMGQPALALQLATCDFTATAYNATCVSTMWPILNGSVPIPPVLLTPPPSNGNGANGGNGNGNGASPPATVTPTPAPAGAAAGIAAPATAVGLAAGVLGALVLVTLA